MGLISFFRDAGQKLFGKEVKAAQADPARPLRPTAQRPLRSRTTWPVSTCR
jgi:hypothetical protein